MLLHIQFVNSPPWVWKWMQMQPWFDEFSFAIRPIAFEQSTTGAVSILQNGVNTVRATGVDALSIIDKKLWVTVDVTPETLLMILQHPQHSAIDI